MKITFLVAVASALTFASPALAWDLHKKAGETQIHFQQRRLHHANTALVWIKNHRSRTLVATPSRFGRAVRDYIWLRKAAERWLSQLMPRPSPPSHEAGWRCITEGAYPGAPHEGNGYNGAYSGPLGMTTPWMGHYPTGSDWVHTPTASVYAAAESEAAKNGFADWWMRSQWPNTYPPCAQYF